MKTQKKFVTNKKEQNFYLIYIEFLGNVQDQKEPVEIPDILNSRDLEKLSQSMFKLSKADEYIDKPT